MSHIPPASPDKGKDMAIKKGDIVRKVIPDIVGEVKGAFLDENLEKRYLVEYADAAGQLQQRYFHEKDLTLDKGETPA